MENRRILIGQNWSATRKGQAVGGLIGLLGTIAIFGLVRISGSAEGMLGFLLVIPGRLAFLPAAKIAGLCGWTWEVAGIYQASVPMLMTMAGFNAIALAIAGRILAALIKQMKIRKD